MIDFSDKIIEAKEKKTLNKPFRTPKGPKKFSVYVKNEKGNVVKVNFGDPNMEIKRDDPNRRKSFRARHNCDNPGPKTKARYWSCKMWEAKKSVTDYTKGEEIDWSFDLSQDEILKINPALANTEEITEADDCDCGGGCGCDSSYAKQDLKKYSFDNPGQAMQMAKKMGFDDIHTHGKGDDTVFMPGPTHEALLKKIGESNDASLWENIHNKRQRIKDGSGEKMRKKGDKGAPTPDQLKKAKGSDDESVEMAKSQLKKASDQLLELVEIMNSQQQIEGWVLSKTTKIEDYVDAIYGYLKYNEEAEKEIGVANEKKSYLDLYNKVKE